MYITIDDYYNVEFYNESKEALKNNFVQYDEFINIKDFKWYIKLDKEPIMVNYDKIASSNERWLVNKVKALKVNEEYTLIRRNDSNGRTSILKYIENKPLKEARKSEYAVFFNIKSKEQIEAITRDIPVKIYYFGKYYNNKFKIGLCTNAIIKNYLDMNDILVEKTSDEPGRFESELNFKVFRMNDTLKKYTDTPYFKNGRYYNVEIAGDRSIGKVLKI